jgi:hypothetical protein
MARRIKFQIEYQKFPKNNLFTILLKKKKEKRKKEKQSFHDEPSSCDKITYKTKKQKSCEYRFGTRFGLAIEM